jgi:hypothetical protein
MKVTKTIIERLTIEAPMEERGQVVDYFATRGFRIKRSGPKPVDECHLDVTVYQATGEKSVSEEMDTETKASRVYVGKEGHRDDDIVSVPPTTTTPVYAVPRVERMLHLCTSHIPGDAAAMLNAGDKLEYAHLADPEHNYGSHLPHPPGFSGYPYEYGWLVWVPGKKSFDNYFEAEDWLKKIYDLAHACGATWIKFDGDEPAYPGLPTFDWS